MFRNFLILLFYFYGTFALVREVTGSDSSKSCDSGWYSFGDKCYKLGKEKLAWSQAEQDCVQYGGHLASIHETELQDFFTSYFLMEAKMNLWIGLHDQMRESRYIWSDGSEYDYHQWAPGEPTEFANHQEDCMVMSYHFPAKVKLGKWNDVSCSGKTSFICQKERTSNGKPLDPKYCSANSDGWKFQDSCFNIVDDKLSWDEAEHFCSSHYSGHLVTIKDIAVSIFLDYILQHIHQDFWIGLKLKEDSPQKWSSGWYLSYGNWRRDVNIRKNMCALRQAGSTWNTGSCDSKLAFLCEASSAAPPTLTPSVNGSICPEKAKDWHDFGGDYCYFFETKHFLSWTDANLNCIQRGGYLASIHSKEEIYTMQPFIEQLPRVHIGLFRLPQPINVQSAESSHAQDDDSDFLKNFWRKSGTSGGPRHVKQQVSDSDFVWTDGSKQNYANWGENQPNRGPENCVDMCSSTLDWHDYGCEKQAGYICSVRKISPQQVVENKSEDNNSRNRMQIAVICVLFCILLAVLGFNVYYFRPVIKNWFQRTFPSVLVFQKYDDIQKSKSTKFTSKDSFVRFERST